MKPIVITLRWRLPVSRATLSQLVSDVGFGRAIAETCVQMKLPSHVDWRLCEAW